MAKNVTDKLKEILTPKDLKIFEETVDAMVDERVALREEELKVKYDTIAEEYVEKKVEEELTKAKAKIVEGYDAKLESLEKKIVTKLDSFLDHVITEQISDETLEKIAINEVCSPVVQKIKKIFSENYIEIDSNGDKIIKELQKKSKDLENQLSESIAKTMDIESKLEKSATFLLITEKTEGLTPSKKQRVTKMFRDKDFNEVQDKIDTFIDMIKESTAKPVTKKPTTKKVIDSMVPKTKDVIKENRKIVPETDNEMQSTFVDVANGLL